MRKFTQKLASQEAVRQFVRHQPTRACSRAKYGGRHSAVLIPGDGVGPQMYDHLKDCFRLIGAPIDFETVHLNPKVYDEEEIKRAVHAIRRTGAAIKGNIKTNLSEQGKARNHRIRTELDLYANVVHAKSYSAVETRHKDVDIYIIRENTEGEYSNMEQESVPGVVEALKIITEQNCERIARFAFQFAIDNGRKKVTCVHKANIMKMADGLFLRTCRKISAEYPSIEFNDMIVDNTCMQLVSRPEQFDVMVTPNLYGSVVGNVCAGLVQGTGLLPMSSYGETGAMFEPATRSTGRARLDENTANPVAYLMAGAKLLEYYNQDFHANLIRDACDHVINTEKMHTSDLRGNARTNDVIDCIQERLEKCISADDVTLFQQD